MSSKTKIKSTKKSKSASRRKKGEARSFRATTRRSISTSSLLVPALTVGPRCNIRVTFDTNPANARSESSIAVNPLNPYNMVAGSKRFTNPSRYEFSLAVYSTFDGGESWKESSHLGEHIF